MLTNEKIGKNIRAAIKEAGISQNRLAERMFLSSSCISTYVNGQRDIPAVRLCEIAEAIGVDVGRLMEE